MTIKYVMFMALMALVPFAYADGWREITPRQGIRYMTPNGKVRVLQPSCSGGPVCTFDALGNPVNCQLADRKFSFFFQPGEAGGERHGRYDDKHNLLIYLDQGGACWDASSCVASAATGAPVYAQTIDHAAI
ncbi:MAG: hypothetical protein ACOYMG_09635, partial [Candidatus Methylumidiphilus sp.]